MIVIEKERCTACGLCEKICHEHCITLAGGIPIIRDEYCSTCTQCIAVCPSRALSWNHMIPTAFDRNRLPSPEQLDELYKERRTIRLFKKEKIERTLLEEIAARANDAPTENFQMRAIIVDDNTIIAELEQALMQLTRNLYPLLKSKIISSLAIIARVSHTYLRTMAKLETVVNRGYVFVNPPAALIFIIGDKHIPLSGDSAQYALANMMYYAQVRGVGAGLCGNGPLFFDKNKKIRKRLGLQKRENILGTIFLGYPAVKFANKVIGKRMPVQWN